MDQAAFKAGLSRWGSGVSVITTADNRGVANGFTATSFASVSLEPPLVLFCLAIGSQSLAAFQENPTFAVNILSEDQQELSNRFAQRDGDKFDGLDRLDSAGSPLLAGCLANLSCEKRDVIPQGDHIIFVGEVVNVIVGEGKPLLYFQGGYAQL